MSPRLFRPNLYHLSATPKSRVVWRNGLANVQPYAMAITTTCANLSGDSRGILSNSSSSPHEHKSVLSPRMQRYKYSSSMPRRLQPARAMSKLAESRKTAANTCPWRGRPACGSAGVRVGRHAADMAAPRVAPCVGLAESRIGLAESRNRAYCKWQGTVTPLRLPTFAWQMSQCKFVSTR